MRHHVELMEATDMRKLSHDARHERRVELPRLRRAGTSLPLAPNLPCRTRPIENTMVRPKYCYDFDPGLVFNPLH